MYVYSFEKLEVWKEAKEITKLIYTISAEFPDSEKFGLTSQLHRAAVSVCSNLAEGTSRNSYKDQAQFTNIAYGSTVEIINQLILGYELNYISESNYLHLRNLLNSLSNKINALRNSQLSKSGDHVSKQRFK